MRYMLLIYDVEAEWAAMTQEEKGKVFGEYMAFTEDMKARGAYIAGAPLQPTATATTVRVREGRAATTDGPFAETKEQLAGYYILDCANLDDAVRYAALIPGAAHGAVEVRPIMDL